MFLVNLYPFILTSFRPLTCILACIRYVCVSFKFDGYEYRMKVFNIHVSVFSLIHLYICGSVCLSVCTAPFGHTEKRYRPEIRYTHSPRPCLKTGFLFFRKNDPEDRQPQKTAASRGFSAYLLDCLVVVFFEKSSLKAVSL